ncbi:MAG: phosphoglucosamine mutase [Chitinophagales bacterium]|nr:phosphoglucosamine mutase [Chitinophagales bacterium]
MTLIKSISGIRGTIGGKSGDNLTPEDIIKFTAAFGQWISRNGKNKTIVIGRDARPSGTMVSALVSNTLQALGMQVIDLGLSTTPTVEVAVTCENAIGGIIITASHNPVEWNALKLLNGLGEFISDSDGREILTIANAFDYEYAVVEQLGSVQMKDSYIDIHINKILDLDLVNAAAIREKKYKIVVDGINSTGGIAIPKLLNALGVNDVVLLNGVPDGNFSHNPEPLPENLFELSQMVKDKNADLGIAVDPDVDRLAFVCEDGSMFGEEYTLVAVADYVLKNKKGNTVSNLSSTRALRDITENAGGIYAASAVGEVNVVKKMKEINAVIGGEGNGGIIYPELHYGRDALVGVALFLSHLATSGESCLSLKARYPSYVISKNKIKLTEEVNIEQVLNAVRKKYANYPMNDEDGVKIEFAEGWVHLRSSNTEPIIRIYAEGKSKDAADELAHKIMMDIELMGN